MWEWSSTLMVAYAWQYIKKCCSCSTQFSLRLVADDIVSSCAEEWRFHVSQSLTAQTNCKWNAWKNYWRARFRLRTWRSKQTAPLGATTSTESNDQQQVSIFTEGFQYSLWPIQAILFPLKAMILCISRNHDFFAQNLSKKVRLIHESLR